MTQSLPANAAALCAAMDQGQTFSFHVFFGQDPAAATADADIATSFLSQAFPAPFVVDGRGYATAEHYMMAQKAYLFGDTATGDAVVATSDPNEAKALGRQAKGFNAALWDAHKSEIVEQGNFYKFSAHKELQARLLATNNKVLVDATPWDKLWAVGLSTDHKDVKSPAKWPGTNLLGFALMAVRTHLETQP
ncbi:Aste57867_7326 [Aphanomyces stellatus]|uniref:Aste57867_7326 protein n=1 Tax=Aphanomyces stellatus TaxID=120398 RepID=A0A485KI60_9STRA|nr:hypothetical protein As57867_007300 [Aphanomyces stellatus]VFT84245.1 Aste57867_7326 [Aphanomyces stellatus]